MGTFENKCWFIFILPHSNFSLLSSTSHLARFALFHQLFPLSWIIYWFELEFLFTKLIQFAFVCSFTAQAWIDTLFSLYYIHSTSFHFSRFTPNLSNVRKKFWNVIQKKKNIQMVLRFSFSRFRFAFLGYTLREHCSLKQISILKNYFHISNECKLNKNVRYFALKIESKSF